MITPNSILLLCGILLFFACGKDNQINLSSCPTVIETGKTIPPYRGPGWGFKYEQSDTFLFDKPYCNPNNKYEFVFWLASTQYNGIYTYNIKTQIRTLVLAATSKKGIPQSQPRWSRKGWILYEDRDHNIYKIKPNGDSLIQLTQTGSEFVPEWSYDGTMFCTEYLGATGYYTMIRDENGKAIDSIQYQGRDLFLGQPDWQHEKYILGNSNNNDVLLYDYKNKSITKIDNKDVSFPRWINEKEFVYATDGIAIMNINTRQIRNIRKSPNSRVYYDINLLDNGQLLCSRTTSYLKDSIMEIIAIKGGIYIANQCDTNVIELNLR